MAIQLECPGCKAVLSVDDSMVGMVGKCIHCGHRVQVPGASTAKLNVSAPSTPSAPPPTAAAAPASAPAPPPPSSKTTRRAPAQPPPAPSGPISPTLFESTPESMMRELGSRGQSAVMFLFRPADDGTYDVGSLPDEDLKCIVTDDIDVNRFGQFIVSVSKRFGPRRREKHSGETPLEQFLYELKGDRLGMTLDEFKRKYARGAEPGRDRLPLCSDEAWGANKAALFVEPWHQQAGIVHARVDLPSENNSPTVAGVKTDRMLYQFVDGRLFRIEAIFPTHQFHLILAAANDKYGAATAETQKSKQYVWDNPIACVVLTKGTLSPPQPSSLELIYKPLSELADSRAPKGATDF